MRLQRLDEPDSTVHQENLGGGCPQLGDDSGSTAYLRLCTDLGWSCCRCVVSGRYGKKVLEKNSNQDLSIGLATDTIALHSRCDLATLDAVIEAASMAYRQSGKQPRDIDLCEAHDCFTIAEVMSSEALCLVDKGQGGQAVESGETSIGGRISINASGGLKSRGNALGANGIAQVVEIVEQLRGDAGERQVENAHVGMTQNIAGTGASSVVHILEAM